MLARPSGLTARITRSPASFRRRRARWSSDRSSSSPRSGTRHGARGRSSSRCLDACGTNRRDRRPPSELRAINRRIFPLWRSSYQDEKASWSLMDLKTHVTGDVGMIAGLALTAVGLVWLIACTNASSLLDRACDEPAPGAGRACGARGLAWPRGPAPAGRKCSSRDWRRRSGFRPGLDGRRTPARLRGWLLSAHGRNRTRRAGVVAPVGSHGSQRAALRTCAVRARQRRPGGRVLALHGALVYRQRGCQTPATSPRRDSVRNRDAASGRRRAASCQPGRIGARQSGLRHATTC